MPGPVRRLSPRDIDRAARRDGVAGERPGQAQQGRQDHRRGDGERGLLDLPAARRRARAVRHASGSTRARSTSPGSRSARAWSGRSPRTSRSSTSPRRRAIPNSPTGPETGEELFHSFAGVPIVRRERAIGVLAVQHAEPRAYDDVEIEALQTVAMVLSELIANAGLADKAAEAGDRGTRRGAGAARRAEAGRRHGARARRSTTSRASSSSIPSPRTSRPSATASIPPSARCASRSTR